VHPSVARADEVVDLHLLEDWRGETRVSGGRARTHAHKSPALSHQAARFLALPSLTDVVLARVQGRQGRARPVATGLAELHVDVLQGAAAAGVDVVVFRRKLIDFGRLVCRWGRGGRAGTAATRTTPTTRGGALGGWGTATAAATAAAAAAAATAGRAGPTTLGVH